MRKPYKIKSQKGFTIVELVVTIMVAAIFFLALNVAYTSYVHLGERVKDLTLANSYAESKVESLRNIGFNSLAVGTTTITNELPSDLNAPRSSTLQISSPQTGLKKIDLTIMYNDQGTSRTYAYTTYIGELGVGQ